MWEIWAIKLLPVALKTCPKSNKSPNLFTLIPLLSSIDGNDCNIVDELYLQFTYRY